MQGPCLFDSSGTVIELFGGVPQTGDVSEGFELRLRDVFPQSHVREEQNGTSQQRRSELQQVNVGESEVSQLECDVAHVEWRLQQLHEGVQHFGGCRQRQAERDAVQDVFFPLQNLFRFVLVGRDLRVLVRIVLPLVFFALFVVHIGNLHADHS